MYSPGSARRPAGGPRNPPPASGIGASWRRSQFVRFSPGSSATSKERTAADDPSAPFRVISTAASPAAAAYRWSSAPSGGFSATKNWWPGFPLWLYIRQATASRTGNRCRGFSNTAASSVESGAMSSAIQMLRPWVPRIRSFSRGWKARSSTGTVGTCPPIRCQVPPRSSVT